MYQIEFTRKAFKTLQKLPEVYQKRILEKIELLSADPFGTQNVKQLKGENNFYRLRIANYRVIYQVINKELVILIIDLNHRKDIY